MMNEIIQPDIEFLGLRIMEPMTMITNILITVVCFYAYYRLRKTGKKGDVILLMQYHFLAMGLACLLSGIFSHGFTYYFSESWKLMGWYFSIASIACLERASIRYALPLMNARVGKFLLWANIIEWIFVVIITTLTIRFKCVELHSAFGFVIVILPLHIFIYKKTRDIGSRYIFYAIGVLVVTIAVFRFSIALHTYFNHRDLAHLLMAIAVYLLMCAALQFKDEEINL